MHAADTERSLAATLSRCWHELGRVLASRRLLASLHARPGAALTPTTLRALDVLAGRGSLRIGELAESLGIDETTATRLVDRLQRLGIAERRSLPRDRRVTVVALTPAGEELAGEVAAERETFFADVLAALEPDEQAELVRLTAKAAESLRSRSAELLER